MEQVGGRNKLAKQLDVFAPYLGRVIRGEKAMTQKIIGRLGELRRSVT